MLTKADKAPDGTVKADEPKAAAAPPVDRTRAPPASQEPHNGLFGAAPFALNISRVVGGRKFDTTTATLVCVISRTGGSPLADFHFEHTGLYRSPRGQFFVAGEGGACSRWGYRAIDGSRVPGDGVELVSEDQARQLLELHGGPVEAFFECEEG